MEKVGNPSFWDQIEKCQSSKIAWIDLTQVLTICFPLGPREGQLQSQLVLFAMPPRNSSRVIADDSDAEDDAIVNVPEALVAEKGWDALSESEQDEYATLLARTLLCKHSTRIPVKRADLYKTVLPAEANIRSRKSIFNGAFRMAQEHLQNIAACEVIECVKQTRGTSRGGTQTATRATATQTASQSQSGGSGQRAYVLISTLPKGARPDDPGTYAERAFLCIVAAIILLKPDCRIEQEELYEALSRAAGVRVVESKGHHQLNDGNVKELLEQTFVKQWYLEREKEGRESYYAMGPRLRAELSDDDLLSFVAAVYNFNTEQSSEMDPTTRRELQQRLDAARGVMPEEDSDDEG